METAAWVKHSLHVISLASILCLAIMYVARSDQWLLVNMYTMAFPILMANRLVLFRKFGGWCCFKMYTSFSLLAQKEDITVTSEWHRNWLLHLLDLCYFVNVSWLIFIWFAPRHHSAVFPVLYALSNGPVLWFLILLRCPLVFQSLDHMTNLFIHMLPSILSFSFHWYPARAVPAWQAFLSIEHTLILMAVVPLALVIFHGTCNLVVFDVLVKPPEKHITLYRMINSVHDFRKGRKMAEWQVMCLFIGMYGLFTLATLLVACVTYHSFLANCVTIFAVVAAVIDNRRKRAADVNIVNDICKEKLQM